MVILSQEDVSRARTWAERSLLGSVSPEVHPNLLGKTHLQKRGGGFRQMEELGREREGSSG